MSDNLAKFDYANEFGSNYHGARRLPPEAEHWIAKVRAEKLQKHIRPTDRVLEYGVGFGWNLAALKCAEKTGFDVTPGLREYVETKGIRFQGDEAALEQKAYDVLVCHHVLEHMRAPLDCLKRLKNLLRDSGQLLLFVPFERERKYLRYRASNRAHHLYSWTQAGLSRMAREAGWVQVSVQLQAFRFDRIAAVIAHKVLRHFQTYQFIRATALFFLPEYEIVLLARKHL